MRNKYYTREWTKATQPPPWGKVRRDGIGVGPRDITVHTELKLEHGAAKELQASPGMLGDVSEQ
jgi:hypothetical protein